MADIWTEQDCIKDIITEGFRSTTEHVAVVDLPKPATDSFRKGL